MGYERGVECESQRKEEVLLGYRHVDGIEFVDVGSMKESWNHQRGPHLFV